MGGMTNKAAPLTSAELIELRAIIERDAIRRVVEGYARGMNRCDEASAREAYWNDANDHHGPFNGNATEFVTWGLALAKESSSHQKTVLPGLSRGLHS